MKINILIISLTIALTGFANSLYAQRCQEFHKSKNCQVEDIQGYKQSSLSRSNILVIGQTIKYEVILYHHKEQLRI